MQNMGEYSLSKIEAYSIGKKGLEGRIKSPIIYGHWGNVIAPLAYIQKPKWLDSKDFEKVVEAITLNLTIESETR